MTILNRNIFQLVKLILTILLISHIFACLWICLAKIEKSFDQDIPSWIDTRDFILQTWKEQYSQAFYFTMVTMITVGYGDIVPQNIIEIWVCIGIMMIACMVFAYSMNTIGQIITSFFELETKISDNLYTINSYMEKKNIDMALQFQVREYLYYYWKHNQQDQQQKALELIQNLPDSIQQNLLREANSIVFKNNEIFENFSDNFKMKVIPLIQELQCPPGFVFFKQEQYDDSSIYFVQKGQVDLFFDSSNQFLELERHLKIKSVGLNDSFGLQQFLTGGRRNLSAKSVEFSNILYIKRDQFIEKLQQFPQDYQKFCHYKDHILHGVELELNIKRCECCNENNHYIDQCPNLNFKKDYRKVSMLCNMGQNEERNKSYKRNEKRKKYSTLHMFVEQSEVSNDFIEFNQDIVELYEDIIEQEEDFFYYQKQQSMLEFEGKVAQENQLAKNLINNKQELQQLYHQNSFNKKNSLQFLNQNNNQDNKTNNLQIVMNPIQEENSQIEQNGKNQLKKDEKSEKGSSSSQKSRNYRRIKKKKKDSSLESSQEQEKSNISLKVPADSNYASSSEDSQKSSRSRVSKKSQCSRQSSNLLSSSEIENNNQNKSEINSPKKKNSDIKSKSNSNGESSESRSSEYLEEQELPKKNVQRKRRETLMNDSNQLQLIERLREKQQNLMNFLSNQSKTKKGGDLQSKNSQAQIQSQQKNLEILQSFHQQNIQNSNNNNSSNNEMAFIQEMMAQLKQEINQNLNKNTSGRDEIVVNLNQDPFFEFEFYFPWHNLSAVLFKRNLKKQLQLKEIKKKQTILESVNKFTELQAFNSITGNNNPLLAQRRSTKFQQTMTLPNKQEYQNEENLNKSVIGEQSESEKEQSQNENPQNIQSDLPEESESRIKFQKNYFQIALNQTEQHFNYFKNHEISQNPNNNFIQNNITDSIEIHIIVPKSSNSFKDLDCSRNQINESQLALKNKDYIFETN